MFHFDVVAAGDSALHVQLPERIDALENAWCIRLARALEEELGGALRDVVVGYCSVTAYFDPLATDPVWLEGRIREMAGAIDHLEDSPGGVVDVPVRYGGTFGPDLAEVARFAGCSEGEVVDIHTAATYRVYLVGFVPGFPYLAEVDRRIAAPRRATPRTVVPPGSVAIAGGQTGIYPSSTPGGWNIIGRTPVKPYDPSRVEPFLFRPGDRVRFFPITAEEFDRAS
jgi:KipI family sensor histidine kinase inhibitor